MQPIKQLSHLYSMRKLFFILLFFGFGNSISQKVGVKTPKFSYDIGFRPLRGEMRAGINYYLKENIIVGPELGYQIVNKNDNTYYIESNFSTYYSSFDPLGNVFILDQSYIFALNYKQYFEKGYFVNIKPYYLVGKNNSIKYYYDWYYYVGPETSVYSGGGLKVQNFGVDYSYGAILISTEKFNFEAYAGGSLFIKRNIVTYNKLDFYGYYGGTSYSKTYNELQSEEIRTLDVRLFTGINIVF